MSHPTLKRTLNVQNAQPANPEQLKSESPAGKEGLISPHVDPCDREACQRKGNSRQAKGNAGRQSKVSEQEARQNEPIALPGPYMFEGLHHAEEGAASAEPEPPTIMKSLF